MKRSVDWMRSIKDALPDPKRRRNPYQAIAEHIRDNRLQTVPASLFAAASRAVLVPVPRSSLPPPEPFHWPARELARALVAVGLGSEVVNLLVRARPVPKSATGGARNAFIQRESLDVTTGILPSETIVLVDDILTSGATAMGAALRLQVTFPGAAEPMVFAAMRTVSDPLEFTRILDPSQGTITLLGQGSCRRRP